MINFFKKIFTSIIVTLISFVIILFVGIGIVASFSSNEETVELKENTLLKITLSNPIIDRALENDISFSALLNDSPTKMSLMDVLDNIEKAGEDANIKGIYLNIENVSASMATLEEIRNKLQEFKDSTDKFIISYSEVYSQSAYYISSVADKVYLHPEGMFELKGLAYQGMFFKNTLEKLEVEAQIIRHGKFKSAVEPFMLDKMSSSNREQVTKFIGSIWSDYRKEVAEDRMVSANEINDMAQKFSIQFPQDAIDYKLADALLFKDQVLDTLKNLLDLKEEDKIPVTSLSNYTQVKGSKKKYSKDRIAVIYAQGEINSGKGDNETIGSETLSKAIRDARLDDKIKAVVLRVNSPGGSALASETILREMQLIKKEKPVVVSMGDVAASGGYYIACAADTIIANPTTITGSIGVFGVLMNAQKMMKNKLGINVDTVKTNKHADIGTPFRALTSSERNIIQNSVEKIYDTFITHVAKGRNMTKEEVDTIGQGRVWTGRDALEIGLVDVLGGLEDAIDLAAKMANLKKYRIKNLPVQKDPIEALFEELNGKARAAVLKSELGPHYNYYKEIKNIINTTDIQMRMPMQFEIY